MHMEHVRELALHYSSRLIEYSLNGSLLVLIAVNVNSCDNANAAMWMRRSSGIVQYSIVAAVE